MSRRSLAAARSCSARSGARPTCSSRSRSRTACRRGRSSPSAPRSRRWCCCRSPLAARRARQPARAARPDRRAGRASRWPSRCTLIALGEERISSSLTGILVATAPIFTFLLAFALERRAARQHGEPRGRGDRDRRRRRCCSAWTPAAAPRRSWAACSSSSPAFGYAVGRVVPEAQPAPACEPVATVGAAPRRSPRW